QDVQSLDYNFSRLLGIRADARQLLSILPDEVITNKQSERNIPDKLLPVFEAEKRASSLYSLISGRKEDIFYHKLAVID
ncbi:MAG: hypothetical protein IJX05_05125, partial [Clostridia bacterium]|nr:hypothetical protein [Clostridia bacterium]